jgi:3,4-dihydroxy 2-butanone 4-phosphate synthase / GTP cyclohydrolase II
VTYASVEEAISAVGRGELVVVVDDADREDEGDLIFAAEYATAEKLGFMIRHTSGVVCATLTALRADELELAPMVTRIEDARQTAFTVSVDYKRGTTTGISASDRATTLRALSDRQIGASEFARPGHVFPLRARAGGVLERPGHTEAASDLARLAGLRPYGVLCELVEDDGSMQRVPSLLRFASEHQLPIITVADLVSHRRRSERWVVPLADAALPTRHGTFRARIYRDELEGVEHVALVLGKVERGDEVLVRVHSECLTSEVFGSLRCDCREQLDAALAAIGRVGSGVLVYLRGHEGRGVGLTNKLRAYAIQDQGIDTVQANLDLGLPVDARRYDAAALILRDLAPRSIRLISNNPAKFSALEQYGIAIAARVRLPSRPGPFNQHYLLAKQRKLGHDLELALDQRDVVSQLQRGGRRPSVDALLEEHRVLRQLADGEV